MNTVASLPAKWRAKSSEIAKPYGFVTELVLGKAHALEHCADELEAALASPAPSVSPAVEGGLLDYVRATYQQIGDALKEHRKDDPFVLVDPVALLGWHNAIAKFAGRLATPKQPSEDYKQGWMAGSSDTIALMTEQPEGKWKLVPVEATPEMVSAARRFSVPGYCIAAEQWPSVYRAMLDAAPAALGAAVVDEAMVERALRHQAFQEDGAQWPDAYGEEEQKYERERMRGLLTAAHDGSGPSAYCRACQASGMSNCQHFDECDGATCITCHRPLNAALAGKEGA